MDLNRTRRLRVGLLSFAHPNAPRYLELLGTAEDVELRAADPGPHPPGELRGETLAARFGVAYATTYEELLAWAPDAVVLASETSVHLPLVRLALAAGIPILCEGLLATSVEEGEAITAAVREANGLLMVAAPLRFASVFQSLKDSHASGRLGHLVAIRGNSNAKLPDRMWIKAADGSGALLHGAADVLDLLSDLTRAHPVRVTAGGNTILHSSATGAATSAVVTVAYHDGLIAAVDCSWSWPGVAPRPFDAKLTVLGTAGTVDLDFHSQTSRGLDGHTGALLEVPYGPDLIEVMLGAFLDGVRNGALPGPTAASALDTLRVVLAADRSARTGAAVVLGA